MIKFVFLVNRIEGMSAEDFVDYHRNHHAPLFASIPETQKYVRKYTISHPILAENYPPPAYDGLTEIWFESWVDHDAFFSSANYKTVVQPDEATFLARGSTGMMVTHETAVV